MLKENASSSVSSFDDQKKKLKNEIAIYISLAALAVICSVLFSIIIGKNFMRNFNLPIEKLPGVYIFITFLPTIIGFVGFYILLLEGRKKVISYRLMLFKSNNSVKEHEKEKLKSIEEVNNKKVEKNDNNFYILFGILMLILLILMVVFLIMIITGKITLSELMNELLFG